MKWSWSLALFNSICDLVTYEISTALTTTSLLFKRCLYYNTNLALQAKLFVTKINWWAALSRFSTKRKDTDFLTRRHHFEDWKKYSSSRGWLRFHKHFSKFNLFPRVFLRERGGTLGTRLSKVNSPYQDVEKPEKRGYWLGNESENKKIYRIVSRYWKQNILSERPSY